MYEIICSVLYVKNNAAGHQVQLRNAFCPVLTISQVS